MVKDKVAVFRRRKQLEQDLAHISQEMYRRNLELAETNQALSLLRSIDSLVLESHKETKLLCQEIADTILTHTNFPLVSIMAIDPHSDRLQLYGLSSSVGSVAKIDTEDLRLEMDEEWLSSSERAKLVKVEHTSDNKLAETLFLNASTVKRIRKAVPIKSVYMVKLHARQRLVGLMLVGFLHDLTEAKEKDQLLLDRLSEAIGIALDNRLLFEENQHIVNQLQKTNTKLKALDETKDEFISMASHQLRTPLTSVKGYLSMVLEGDTGKITPEQRKMLDQAFTSSQRMVYLIADLLNVSRLRTGKFVIEAVPTNLADVIQGEVEQLMETAAVRGLKITYKKPKSFPTLMLDETKIRQVIMNFIDNAIYYTPSGGHIEIELKETPKSVELIVTDNGIGVPKAEQHHLFNKFYRAGNARKARPDGTGLGLFMAKKVIVAQGGSIIFKSQEGKGSTFGFTFSKEKLAVPATDSK